jgi:hypothetical protein
MLSSRWLTFAAIGIVIIIVIIGTVRFPETLPDQNNWRWIGIAVFIVFFLAIIGKAINGRWIGILIDERKVMSLSRFQIILWTVIIVSAYYTIASARILAPVDNPLAIAIDNSTLALLGISSASLVGTPLILYGKKGKEVDEKKESKELQDIATRAQKKPKKSQEKPQIEHVAEQRNQEDKDTTNVSEIKGEALLDATKENRQGIVFVNRSDKEARFSDIFEGDEIGNERHVDMSKVQMFFFTIIAALGYVVMLFSALVPTTPPDSLPILPPGLIALLGISHGAYLANKTVNHTSIKLE